MPGLYRSPLDGHEDGARVRGRRCGLVATTGFEAAPRMPTCQYEGKEGGGEGEGKTIACFLSQQLVLI